MLRVEHGFKVLATGAQNHRVTLDVKLVFDLEYHIEELVQIHAKSH